MSSQIQIKAKILPSPVSSNYDEHIAINLEGVNFGDDIDVFFKPLPVSSQALNLIPNKNQSFIFENIAESEISCFIVFEIFHKSQRVKRFLIKHDKLTHCLYPYNFRNQLVE